MHIAGAGFHARASRDSLRHARASRQKMARMKLAQNQVWKQGDEYLRIVQLERLEVHFKTMKSLLAREGAHHHASKKEFCRLIKGATLLTQEEVRELWKQESAALIEPPASAAEEQG